MWAWTGFADKTLWDWVQLLSSLAIPVVLAIAGFLFTTQQDESAREIEEQRAQDEALQAYLDQMSTLMLDTNPDLRNSEGDSEVQTLARARTATVIQRLDAYRNWNVIRFLQEANLTGDGQSSISLLAEADLQGARLEGVDLSTSDLSGTNLIGAHLSEAWLTQADLSGATLRRADLRGADLRGADLKRADLRGALLAEADLREADLHRAEGVNKETLEQHPELLLGAKMPDGTVFERYATREFEPALSLRLRSKFDVQERPDMLFIEDPGDRAGLTFTSPVHVFDPSNPSELKEVAAPDNADGWASWFQKHPNLDTISKPDLMSVGGKSGVRIDVTSTPENSSRDYCGRMLCVPLFPFEDGIVVSHGGSKDRFVIVDDVEGKTVVIHVSAPSGEFDKFISFLEAWEVLDSVEWNGR